MDIPVHRPTDFSRWLHRYGKWDPKAEEQQQQQQQSFSVYLANTL